LWNFSPSPAILNIVFAGFAPGYTGDWDKQIPTDQCFPYRRVNGAWPYLSKDVERDTTLAQFSRTGRIEKAGAVLTVEPGRMGCVEFEPISGTYVGYTPLPDATDWRFTVPGGIMIEPDGRVGMLRVSIYPRDNSVIVEHTLRPGEPVTGMATVLRLRGMDNPKIILNGRDIPFQEDGRIMLPRGQLGEQQFKSPIPGKPGAGVSPGLCNCPVARGPAAVGLRRPSGVVATRSNSLSPGRCLPRLPLSIASMVFAAKAATCIAERPKSPSVRKLFT
jgi:hypothetical protein